MTPYFCKIHCVKQQIVLCKRFSNVWFWGIHEFEFGFTSDNCTNVFCKIGTTDAITQQMQQMKMLDDEERRRKNKGIIIGSSNPVGPVVNQREVKKPRVNQREMEMSNREFYKLSTRVSPNSMFLASKSLSVAQRILLQKNGFEGVISLCMSSLPSQLGYFLVDSYNTDTQSIEFMGKSLRITEETIQSMVGLPKGLKNFYDLTECAVSDPEYEEWKNQYEAGKYNNGNYLKRIRSTDVADNMFRCNFIALFMNTFGDTAPSGSTKVFFLRRLIKVKDWTEINWCGFMLDCLQKSRLKWRPLEVNSYYTGPIEILMVSVCV